MSLTVKSEQYDTQQDLFSTEETQQDTQQETQMSSGELRKGKWLKSEEKVLTQNAQEFLRENGLTEYSEVFSLPARDQKEFFQKCAEGINRQYELIWRKCLRTFNPLNKLGKYTNSEEQQLMVLFEKYRGEKDLWVIIGAELGRSNASVRDKMKQERDSRSNSNKVRKTWTTEEKRLLKEGMKKYKMSGNSGCKTQWSMIASYVGTKKARDCMFRWNQFNVTETLQTFTLDQEIMLVTAMNKMKANHLSDIDWYEISLQWPHKVELRVLRTAFNRIRNRYVSSDLKASTTHHEMMDILMEHFVERVKREAVKFAQVGNSLLDNNDKENNDEDVLSLSESDDSDATEA